MLHVHGAGSCSLSEYCEEGINRYSTTGNAHIKRIGIDGLCKHSKDFPTCRAGRRGLYDLAVEQFVTLHSNMGPHSLPEVRPVPI